MSAGIPKLMLARQVPGTLEGAAPAHAGGAGEPGPVAARPPRRGGAGKRTIGFTEIKERFVAHRYPLLMLDRITDYEPGEYVEAIKCVTGNAPELVGHFPQRAILPGTFIVQALAQLAIVFLQLSSRPLAEHEMTVVTATKFRFFRPVFPGDTLRLRMTPVRLDEAVGIFDGTARVDGLDVARGSLTLARTLTSRYENALW